MSTQPAFTKEEVERRITDMLIHITEDCIRQGEKCHCGRCPIALAIKKSITELFPNNSSCIAVDESGVSIAIGGDVLIECRNSFDVAQFVEQFDSNNDKFDRSKLKPFTAKVFKRGDALFIERIR